MWDAGRFLFERGAVRALQRLGNKGSKLSYELDHTVGKELSPKNISLSDYVESGLTCFFQSNDTGLFRFQFCLFTRFCWSSSIPARRPAWGRSRSSQAHPQGTRSLGRNWELHLAVETGSGCFQGDGVNVAEERPHSGAS